MQCMPPFNGIEDQIEIVRNALTKQAPGCRIEIFDRRDFMRDDAEERAKLVDRADALLLFTGPAATAVHVTWTYGLHLEAAGLPVGIVLPASLSRVAAHEVVTRGTPLRTVLAWRNGSGIEATETLASDAIAALLAPVEDSELESGPHEPWQPQRYAADGSAEAIEAVFEAAGISDGIPIKIPTDDAVETMLQGTRRLPTDVVCEALQPGGLRTTVEQVAINAVMAGARPDHLPVILAASSMLGSNELASMTRSVNSFAFTFLANGPIALRLGIESGMNALGSGNPANDVIARAIRFVLRNCGRQIVGTSSTPVQGSAAGLGVVAENEADTPFAPLHTTLGYDDGESCLSFFVGGFSITGNYYYGSLTNAAQQMQLFENRTGALLLLSAKRARELADAGLSRDEIADTLWQGAKAPLGEIRRSGFFPMMRALISRGGEQPLWPANYLTRPDEDVVPMFPRTGLHVAVVGSEVGSVMQLWDSTLHAHCRIDDWA